MKVVIVSGYFNPLHGGHLDMIEAAAKMGDYLIVVVIAKKRKNYPYLTKSTPLNASIKRRGSGDAFY